MCREGSIAQGESEAAALEANLFGVHEFETEVAANEMAHEAALSAGRSGVVG